MGSVNVTVRVDEETKREFDIFCENVGINMTTAFNMFIRATLRNRELPFAVTDNSQMQAKQALRGAFKTAQVNSVANGTDKLTLDDINAEVASCRQEKQARQS